MRNRYRDELEEFCEAVGINTSRCIYYMARTLGMDLSEGFRRRGRWHFRARKNHYNVGGVVFEMECLAQRQWVTRYGYSYSLTAAGIAALSRIIDTEITLELTEDIYHEEKVRTRADAADAVRNGGGGSDSDAHLHSGAHDRNAESDVTA